MAEFTDDDQSGSRFERVDLTGAQFRTVELPEPDSRSRLTGVVLRGFELVDGEWSFIETLCHTWSSPPTRGYGALLVDPSPWIRSTWYLPQFAQRDLDALERR